MKIGALGWRIFSATIFLSVVLLSVQCSVDDPADPLQQCGEACDGGEECDAPADCDDGVGCTDDACTDGECSNTPNDANCDNGLFCDGTETCHADDDCLEGTAPAMDDAIACTEDFCDEESDRLVNAALDLSDARIVDVLGGNRLESVLVDQQVLAAADLQNLCDDREVDFAFLLDIRDPAGDLTNSFVTGSLAPGQTFSPALSWIPLIPGRYEISVSVGESPDAPPMRRAPVIFIEAE